MAGGLIVQGIRTFKQYGLRVFILRIYNYTLFKIKRIISGKDIENIQRFQSLKNKYKGKRIFIVGNGPSLNFMPLYLLKDEYTFCFNRFSLMSERINWFPTFYAVTDDLVLKDQAKELNEHIIPKVKNAFFPDLHPSNLSVKKIIHNADNVLWLHVDKPDFSDCMPNCGINKTVVNAAIQIAAYMGFTEIYLIGVDMTFGEQKVKKKNSRNWMSEGEDVNHFDPRYFGKGRSYHNPGVEEMLEKFAACKHFFDKRGVSIYNAGYGGKLEIFPRVCFEDILNISDSKREKMFMQAIQNVRPEVNLSDIKELYEVTENVDCDFKIPTDRGVEFLKRYIFTHIPFGPYWGFYYFLKR